MAEQETYAVRVHRGDDGSLWAEVDELPGCFASGDTLDELNKDLAAAISLYRSEPGREVVATVDVTGEQVLVREAAA
jgi:hypothetical protein